MDECKECLRSSLPNPEPVCGSDKRTYINACLLKCATCQNPEQNIQEKCKGDCPCHTPTLPPSSCQQKCFKCKMGISNLSSRNEVCGSDDRKYTDSCTLLCASCYNPRLVEQCKGKCPCNRDPCVRYCNDEFVPVCGTDGLTYPNVCILEQVSCLNPSKDLAKQCMGRCPCKQGNKYVYLSVPLKSIVIYISLF